MPVQSTCAHCGTPFARPSAQRFCSKACAYQGRVTLRSTDHPNFKAKIPFTCTWCGGPGEAWPYRANQRFCTTACMRAFQNANRAESYPPSTETSCAVCGITFKTHAYRLRQGMTYCTRACAVKARLRGETRICLVCRTSFYASASRLRFGPAQCCSTACAATLRVNTRNRGRGGYAYRAWRQAVLTRDRRLCIDCGGSSKLHAHHIRLWATNPALRFDVNNGVTLCDRCHRNRHITDGTYSEYQRGF